MKAINELQDDLNYLNEEITNFTSMIYGKEKDLINLRKHLNFLLEERTNIVIAINEDKEI